MATKCVQVTKSPKLCSPKGRGMVLWSWLQGLGLWQKVSPEDPAPALHRVCPQPLQHPKLRDHQLGQGHTLPSGAGAACRMQSPRRLGKVSCSAREPSGYKVGLGSWVLCKAECPTTDPDTSSPNLTTCWPGLLSSYTMEPKPIAQPASLGPKECMGMTDGSLPRSLSARFPCT